MNAHLSGCIAAACVLCAVVFLTDPAFAQGNAPEITIVGRGTDPVRVFVDGVEVRTLGRGTPITQRKRATAPDASDAEAPSDEEELDEANGEDSGSDPEPGAAPPAPPASKEEVAPPRADLLRQIMQDELARTAVPTLPTDGRGRSLDRGGEADRGQRTYSGARGLDWGGEAAPANGGYTLPKGVELTDEEKRILTETRAQLKSQTWSGTGASSEGLTEEQLKIRQQLNQEVIDQAITRLPKKDRLRDRGKQKKNYRVNRGINPADTKVPIPPHLLQQPAARLPEKGPRAFRDRTEKSSASSERK